MRLEGRLALEMDVTFGTVVLVFRFVFVFFRHVPLMRLFVLEGDAAVSALVFHLALLPDALLGADLFMLLPAVHHVVAEGIVTIEADLACK